MKGVGDIFVAAFCLVLFASTGIGCGAPDDGTRVARAKSGERMKVAAYLDPELGARLRRHCFDSNVKISDVIAVALGKHLA